MKRELAALETKKSPVLNSFGRKTRSSTRSSGVVVSESLVYKRVKKSSSVAQVKKAEVLRNGVNDGVEVSKTNEVVSQQNGVHEARKDGENGVVEVEEKEVAKEVNDEVEEKVADGSSLVENGASPRNVVVLGVAAVDGLMKNVECKNDSEVKNGVVIGDELHGNGDIDSVDKEELVEGVSKRSPLKVVGGDELHGDGDVVEDEKEKRDGGVSKRSPLKVVNGNGKNSPVERYPRRFTRSALKSKADTTVVGNETVQKSAEKTKEVTREPVTKEANGEVSEELAIVVYQMNGSMEEVKKSSTGKYKRRLTRSASKLKVEESNVSSVENVNLVVEKAVPVTSNEHVEKAVPVTSNDNVECDMDKHDEETSSETPRRKLEMKMSKQISPARIPCTVQELFGTGMLEGCPVYYDGGKGPELHGRIRGIGILCSCGLCKDQKVIPPSLFEIHACNTYKRAVQYIYLENGRSLIQILKTCKSSRFDTLEATIQNAIGPLPEKKLIVCQNCKESFSTMDAESSEPVCSTCVMSNLSPIGPVYSTRKRCRSSKFTFPPQAASACDVDDGSQQKSVERSPAYCTPNVQSSQADLLSDVLQDRRRLKSVKKSADASQTLRRSTRVERISETKTSEDVIKNSEEASVVSKTSSSPVLGKSSEAKRHKKLKERSFKSALSPKPSKSSRMGKPSPRNGSKSSERLKKELLISKPLKTPAALASSEKKTSGKITRKDLRLHKLVFEDDVLPEGTELGYYARGQKLLDGYKKGSGIFCNCCDTVISASQFEAHAGCASRRKPYCYIYTSNGVSLHELSVSLIKDRWHPVKYNDDLCSICADGGNLLLCDGCPRAFHKECASLPSIPVGKWYCKYCQNMFEREKFVAHNANAVAAGRVSGVDPIEQITKRSIRIVNNLASEVSACILCRGHDFCKSGFGPRTIILCDQCEKEYHVGCLKEHDMADLTELPDGKWFCSLDCGRIESSLQNLLVHGVEKLPGSLLDIIRKKSMQNGSDSGSDLDVSWKLLSGKIASPETRPLLSQAVAIFHESFAPIIDVVSGHDLIPAMVYGRNVGGQEFGGMYCAVLTVNSVVVSAGIFRIFGPEVAELPLVATSSGNHGKGYFQILFACIEKLLAFLNVKTIVLPAAEEAGSIWTDRFGFTRMTTDQLCELKKNFWSVVRFQGTSMLNKVVPECPASKS